MQNLHCTKSGPGRRHDGKRFHITKRGVILYPDVRNDKVGLPHGVPGAKLLRAARNKTLGLRGRTAST